MKALFCRSHYSTTLQIIGRVGGVNVGSPKRGSIFGLFSTKPGASTRYTKNERLQNRPEDLSRPVRQLKETIASSMTTPTLVRYKLVFTVPHEHKEACKDALFAAGAGQWPNGKYSRVCFEIPGKGQFLPMEGAVPNIGDIGKVEFVEEMRIEMICVGEDVMRRAVEELKKTHPYEEPAYEVYKMEDV